MAEGIIPFRRLDTICTGCAGNGIHLDGNGIGKIFRASHVNVKLQRGVRRESLTRGIRDHGHDAILEITFKIHLAICEGSRRLHLNRAGSHEGLLRIDLHLAEVALVITRGESQGQKNRAI